MIQRYPDNKPKNDHNWVKAWPFARHEKGDLVVLPLKTQRAIQIGEITGIITSRPAGRIRSSTGGP